MTADQRDTPAVQPRNLPGIIQAAGDLVAASQDRALVAALADPGRGWDAIVIGE